MALAVTARRRGRDPVSRHGKRLPRDRRRTARSTRAPTARTRIEQLEARWSRFRPDSELCRLNAAAGRPVLVSRRHARGGRRGSRGVARDRRSVRPDRPPCARRGSDTTATSRPWPRPAGPHEPAPAEVPAPGCDGIEIDRVVGAITLPTGTAIDLGGIGKGLAADLVVDELMNAGADGACVNAGGDLRVAGRRADRRRLGRRRRAPPRRPPRTGRQARSRPARRSSGAGCAAAPPITTSSTPGRGCPPAAASPPSRWSRGPPPRPRC